MSKQAEFDFLSPPDSEPDGVATWRKQREDSMRAVAQKNGIPLGKPVRVDFPCGPSLEGVLQLDEEMLFVSHKADAHLRLRVGEASFNMSETSAIIEIAPSFENGTGGKTP